MGGGHGGVPQGAPRAAGWQEHLPAYATDVGTSATRARSGEAINALARVIPELVGGSADLAPSTNTTIDGADDIAAGQWHGRNFHFGVREHAMGAVLKGLAAHGGLRPFGASFLVFSDYLRPALRLSALMGLPVVYVFTHDSVGMGEDGPPPTDRAPRQPPGHPRTHRAAPRRRHETAAAWRAALESDGPTALILSRQRLPALPTDQIDVGGAVIADGDHATILATGSEVHIALDARDQLVPPQRPTVSVEAGASQGWHEFADAVVGIDRFGLSAPGADALAETGITAEDVADAVLATLDR